MNSMMTKERKIDIIFCIDGTGSMVPCIDRVRANAKKFYMDFVDSMTREFNSTVDELNVKVIVFRDYGADSYDMAMAQSDWFDLTAGDTDLYEKYLDSIVADGGGDLPENGLEALFKAMTADWKSLGPNDRQVIIMFTDADAKEIGTTTITRPDGSVEDMVDEVGLENTWMGNFPAFLPQDAQKLRERGKRLVIYAPSGTKYETLTGKLNRSVFIPTEMNKGMKEIDFSDVIKVLAASASMI